jgi:hypothetical protein
MIGNFLKQWRGAFGDAWRVARALPLLVALMVGIEFAQHVIELQLGFFSTDLAVRKLAATQPLRMMFGWPKMAMVYAVGFVVTRYLVTGDAAAAIRPPAAAVRRYAWVVLFQLIPAAVIIYAEPIVAAAGLAADSVMSVRGVFGLAQQLLEPLLLLWFVSAALGSDTYGPVASARATRWLYFWTLLLIFVTRVPLSALHQFLNRWPVGQGAAAQWSLLAADAIVVGVLTLAVSAAQVRGARVIADRRGSSLV